MEEPILRNLTRDKVGPFTTEDTDPFPLSQVLNSLSTAIMVTDEQLNIAYHNQRFAEIFLVNASSAGFQLGIRNRQFKEVTHNFLRPDEVFEKVNALRSNQKKPVSVVAEMIDGKHFSISHSFFLQNETTYSLFSFDPLTTLLPDRKDILKQKNLYKSILTNLPSDIVVLSADFKYLFLNPTAIQNEEIRQWMIGKTDLDYCTFFKKDIAIAEKRKAVYQQVISTKKSIEWEEQLMGPANEVEHHLKKMNPVLDDKGEVKLLIGYGINITERKKIEDRIQLSEKRYRDLFNYSQAIICTHDLEGKFLTVNPALCTSLDYTEEEIIGKTIYSFLPPEDEWGFNDIYLRAIHEESKAKGVLRVIKKDGSKVYLLYENFKVEEKGIQPYVIGFAQDITDRINAEKELKYAKKLTEETSLLKERFLANMSHEIRTPMNGILGITNLLHKTPLDAQQKHYLRIINDSAQNLLTIINDILDIEKIAAGEVKIECIPFDIVHRTQSILDMFEHTAQEKGIGCTFENHLGHELNIKGDPTRFNQVLNNLVSNALKFTSTGSVKVVAEKTKETETDFMLQFSVIDTGIGIEENKLTKIFEPFAQAYPETTRKYGGTGLGLAITKNLLELQQGTVAVQSKVGYGSKFTFTINYKKDLEPIVVQDDEPELCTAIPNNLGHLRVLLAEDNEVNQLLAKSILMYWGIECQTACTGNEAIQLLEKNDFDVILMDIQMPEKSGLEATSEIRNFADKRKRSIPIIALTANALKGEEKKYIEVGMDDFLTKPFKEKDLHEVITRVMENKGSFGRNLNPQHENHLTTSMVHNEKILEDDRLFDMNSLNDVSRGNKDFIVTLAKIFLNTVPKNCVEMAEAAEGKNWDRVSNLAHKLKPTIDTMNIKSIKQEIRAIEINAKNKADLSSIPRQIEKVIAVINKTGLQLQQEFSL